MPSRTFTVDELDELEVRYSAEFSERVDSGRWSEYFDVVFRADDGKLYFVRTEEGLTEIQMDAMYREDHYPDAERNGGDYFVKCPQVELYQEMVPVTKWRKVSDE